MTAAQRLIVRLDKHLPWANDIDFTVVGDVNNDGAFNAIDAALIQQRRLAGTAGTASIPAISAASGQLKTPSLNLSGSLSNFALSGSGSIRLATASSEVLQPVTLQVMPSPVSQGAGT